ncbi:MAG: hypothetical protein M1812_007183 [Candelaria pacifica]|nr:MAG: hypothetical protein M1812_007183 [Candelaria pacifica]
MHSPLAVVVALAATGVLAAPAPFLHIRSAKNPKPWDTGAVNLIPIHESCNDTETTLIRKGLNEAIQLAGHAKAHILRYGNSSATYRKYFGDAPSMDAIGSLDKIVGSDKGHVLFRCDNPDGNCALPGYGGHWRGSNATNETVICPLSYDTRLGLESLCTHGYTVSQSPANTYWASDLMHRLYHMPSIGEDYVEHFTEEYPDVLELAKNNNTYSGHDSDTLQFFALEAYAYDIAVPDVGCPGPVPSGPSPSSTTAASSAPVSSASASASASESSPPQTTSAPPQTTTAVAAAVQATTPAPSTTAA